MVRCSCLIGFFAIALIALAKGSVAVNYTVGDDFGWAVPRYDDFYEDWARNKTFNVGDTLLFSWNGNHTATEVSNEEEYDNCTKMGIILASSPVMVNLTSNGTRYFLCSVGTHCEQGQKFKITVGNGTNGNDDSAAAALVGGTLTVLASTMVTFLLSHLV